MTEDLDQRRREEKVLRDELTTRINTRRKLVKKAEANVELASISHSKIESASELVIGMVALDEIDKAKSQLMDKKFATERAKALLSSYHSVDLSDAPKVVRANIAGASHNIRLHQDSTSAQHIDGAFHSDQCRDSNVTFHIFAAHRCL